MTAHTCHTCPACIEAGNKAKAASMLGDWNDVARNHGRKQRRRLTEAETEAILLFWGKAYPLFSAGARKGQELAQILMDRP